MKLLISAVTFDEYLKSGMCQLELVPMADKYNCVGVEFRPYWRSPVEELPEIKEFLGEYNQVCTYACNESLLGESPEVVYQALANMRKSIDFAERVGAKLLRINVASGPFGRELLEAQWWQEAVQETIDYSAAREITLAIENPPYAESGDPKLILDILSLFDSPWLRVTYDTGNWLVAGYDATEALEMLMPYIVYVHLKDIIANPSGFTPSHLGRGVIDVLGLIEQLKERGYTGFYVLEFPGGSGPAKRIQSSLKYLNGVNIRTT